MKRKENLQILLNKLSQKYESTSLQCISLGTSFFIWFGFECFFLQLHFMFLRTQGKNQPNILAHQIYLGTSHSDSTHINGLSYTAPRISFKKQHQRMTGGQNLLFILFLLSIIQLFPALLPLSQAKGVQM